MENKPYGIIYMIVNLVNGKKYIGQTTKKLSTRFRGHISNSRTNKNMAISLALHKYGKEKFLYGEICKCYSKLELNEKERYYILYYKTMEYGYNLVLPDKDGGFVVSESTREKHRKYAKSKKGVESSRKAGLKNRGIKRNKKSNFIGIYQTKNKKWKGECSFNNQKYSTKPYNSQKEAAQARDILELKLQGENAFLNFPELKEDYINNKINPIPSWTKKSDSPKGVSYCNKRNKWVVRITGFKMKRFEHKEDAIVYANECYKT